MEHIPWSDGKRPVTCTMMGFLARWARRLSWRETARAFQTSWEAVYRSVEWFVEWGLAHCQLSGVEAIGVDEIHWGRLKRADNSLTSSIRSMHPADVCCGLGGGVRRSGCGGDWRRWGYPIENIVLLLDEP